MRVNTYCKVELEIWVSISDVWSKGSTYPDLLSGLVHVGVKTYALVRCNDGGQCRGLDVLNGRQKEHARNEQVEENHKERNGAFGGMFSASDADCRGA